jgi:hypothetical protein
MTRRKTAALCACSIKGMIFAAWDGHCDSQQYMTYEREQDCIAGSGMLEKRTPEVSLDWESWERKHTQQKWPWQRVHVTWLQPPFFWMGALQPGQALVLLVTHDSLWLAANFCASLSIAFQSRTCVHQCLKSPVLLFLSK